MAIDINQTFPIYFATNRCMRGTLDDPDFGDHFHTDGPGFYRVGTATVSKTSDDLDNGYKVEAIQVEREGDEDRNGDKTKRRRPPQHDLGSDRLFASIRRQVDLHACNALIYIHGFANSFKGAISRAAQLHEHYLVGSLKEPKHPVVFAFCWPSNGQVFPPWEYHSDRDDARLTGPAMARSMLRFRDFMQHKRNPCKQRIHLVAHSMGNWALRHAVQALAIADVERQPQRLFENVFLMAADEDDDAFEEDCKLKPLLNFARRIHVYHSDDDRSLVISDTTKFNPNRLGFDGPRNLSAIDKRIVTIDCEDVDDTEFLHVNHQYYRRRPEVIADVRHVLAGKRPSSIPNRVAIEPGRHYRIKPAVGRPTPVLSTPKKPVSPTYFGHL